MGQGGSGLGMNIVYNIVTGVLKGTIQVESEPGRGTVVTLVLPTRPRETAPVELFGFELPAPVARAQQREHRHIQLPRVRHLLLRVG